MLPQDPYILVSFLNTELRDRFDSLEELCQFHQAQPPELLDRLERIGFRYDPAQKRFRRVANEKEGKI